MSDPTHGRIEKDIQDQVEEMRPYTLGQRVALENTLQSMRDRERAAMADEANGQAEAANYVAMTPLEHTVFQKVGQASMCWETLHGAGVFDSTQAAQIANDILMAVSEHTAVLVRRETALQRDVINGARKQIDELRKQNAWQAEQLRKGDNEPRLGFATTQQLLNEIQVRLDVHFPEALAYSTVKDVDGR